MISKCFKCHLLWTFHALCIIYCSVCELTQSFLTENCILLQCCSFALSSSSKYHVVLKAFSLCPGNLPRMRVLFTFYASTIVSALMAAERMTDTIVSKLLPYIQKVLKSSVFLNMKLFFSLNYCSWLLRKYFVIYFVNLYCSPLALLLCWLLACGEKVTVITMVCGHVSRI